MSEVDPMTVRLQEQLRRQAAEEARYRIARYIAREAMHTTVGTYENDDDPNEGKN